MLTFKEFLIETNKDKENIITGFATIHKDDDSDKHLKLEKKKVKKEKMLTGFASIHKNDDSDEYLDEEKKSEKIEVVEDPYHKKYLEHIGKNKTSALQHSPFVHHDKLNLKDSYHLNNYTESSRSLNKALINKKNES